MTTIFPNGYAIASTTGSALTGTAATTAGSGVLAGTSTAWNTELAVGNLVEIGGQWHTVQIVTDLDTVTVYPVCLQTGTGLTVTKYAWNTLGLLGSSLVTVPPPQSIWNSYTKPIKLADGSLRGGGWQAAEWHWGFITQAQRTLLRAYIPEVSAVLNIVTRPYDSSDFYNAYRGVAIWPVPEDRQTTRRLKFTIMFQRLETLSLPVIP